MSLPPPPLDPQPIRAEPYPYGASHGRRGRPGILTAVGVISIVLASFGLLVSAGELVQTFFMGTVMPRMVKTAMMYTPSGDPTNSDSDTINEATARMSAPNRAMVLAELNKLKPLPQPRQEMIERLLADVGDDLMPFDQSQYTPERIAGSISESGKLPSAGDQKEGNHFYVLANGRIEVADNHTVFSPSRRGAAPIRVYRAISDPSAPAQQSTPATMPTSMPFNMPTYSSRSISLAYASGLLGMAFAAFLMVIGIMVMRDSPRARGLHLFYAAVKLLLVGLGVYTSLSWYSDQMKSYVAMGLPMPGYVQTLRATLMNLPGILYPIALLIVMNTAAVREYFRSWATSGQR